jgi:hypothetical protein
LGLKGLRLESLEQYLSYEIVEGRRRPEILGDCPKHETLAEPLIHEILKESPKLKHEILEGWPKHGIL